MWKKLFKKKATEPVVVPQRKRSQPFLSTENPWEQFQDALDASISRQVTEGFAPYNAAPKKVAVTKNEKDFKSLKVAAKSGRIKVAAVKE